MDIISQLQGQVNTIASLTFNTFGTLQRDSPPVRLSPNYPEPPANPTEDAADFAQQPKLMGAALVKAAKQVQHISVSDNPTILNHVKYSEFCNLWRPKLPYSKQRIRAHGSFPE